MRGYSVRHTAPLPLQKPPLASTSASCVYQSTYIKATQCSKCRHASSDPAAPARGCCRGASPDFKKAAAEVATVEEVRKHHALPNYNNFWVDAVRSRYYADRRGLVWPARGKSVVKVHLHVMDSPYNVLPSRFSESCWRVSPRERGVDHVIRPRVLLGNSEETRNEFRTPQLVKTLKRKLRYQRAQRWVPRGTKRRMVLAGPRQGFQKDCCLTSCTRELPRETPFAARILRCAFLRGSSGATP
jgi:hypothetical protein